jgi:hypothetical protein
MKAQREIFSNRKHFKTSASVLDMKMSRFN